MNKFVTILYADGVSQTHSGVKELTCDDGRVTINLGRWDQWVSDNRDVIVNVAVQPYESV